MFYCRCNRDFGIFLALCGLLLASGLNACSEKCSYTESHGKGVHARTGGNGSDPHCNCYRLNGTPWSKEEVEPAARPVNVSVKFGKNPIHPKITWTYRAAFLQQVDGFYLEICVRRYCRYQYICDVEVESFTKKQAFVSFEFDQCCTSVKRGVGFKPEDEVAVKVHARPMYNIDDHSYYVRATAIVPAMHSRKTERKRPNRTENKKRHRKHSKAAAGEMEDFSPRNLESVGAEFSDEEKTISDLKIAIAAAGTSLLFCCIFSLAACWHIRRSKHRSVKSDEELVHRRILVIGDDDSSCFSLLDKVIEMLKKYGRGSTEITSNRRKVSEIASQGMIRWAARKISEADVVVSVITKADQIQLWFEDDERLACSHVGVALGIAESETLKVGFKSARRKFLVLHAVSCRSLPFCTHYSFSQKDLDMFLQHTLGPHYQYALQSEDRGALQKFVSYLENVPREATIFPKNRAGCTAYSSNQLWNNLDDSISYATADYPPSMTPNVISQEDPNSIESNSSK